MKHIITRAACITALLCLGSAHAFIKEIEKGYEVNQLRVTMFSADTGQVLVNECDHCEDKVLEITPATKLFKGKQELPLIQVMQFLGKEGVVFREMESNKVTRIWIY